ncbi:MAG TPA: glycosyltransferase [Phycisphaerales bacterium]|nr:glycosyltransferase [Phycisphaerales bacterium]
MTGPLAATGVVVIGRNEAPRVGRALEAARGAGAALVYVDSGSVDGSAELAEARGVPVVRLTEGPFTAARGRAAGVHWLERALPGLRYIQFIDGDCALEPGWAAAAADYLESNPGVAAVVGTLRELHAGTSWLSRLVSVEWDLPIGAVDVIGGISMMRADDLRRAGGWRTDMVAGEELDLSSRLLALGARLVRLDRPMCTHDMGIRRPIEYWRRSVRTGHGYAQLASEHARTGPARWRRRALGAVAYGLMLPAALVVALALFWPAAVALASVYVLLAARIFRWRVRRGDEWRVALLYALATTICKTAAGLGVVKFLWGRITGRRHGLFEYKRPGAPAALSESAPRPATAEGSS